MYNADDLKAVIRELEQSKEDESVRLLYEATSKGLDILSWDQISDQTKQHFRNIYQVTILAMQEMSEITTLQIAQSLLER